MLIPTSAFRRHFSKQLSLEPIGSTDMILKNFGVIVAVLLISVKNFQTDNCTYISFLYKGKFHILISSRLMTVLAKKRLVTREIVFTQARTIVLVIIRSIKEQMMLAFKVYSNCTCWKSIAMTAYSVCKLHFNNQSISKEHRSTVLYLASVYRIISHFLLYENLLIYISSAKIPEHDFLNSL